LSATPTSPTDPSTLSLHDALPISGARQDREQRHLGKGDRRIAVVGHQDVLAGHGQLVPAAGARPVHDAEPRLLRLAGRFLDGVTDRKSTRLNSSHVSISYAVFCLK